MKLLRIIAPVLLLFAASLPIAGSPGSSTASAQEAKSYTLLNVSYDPTRELWRDLNSHFIKKYKQEKNAAVEIKQSHGGSSTQARAVIDGLDADVVTLAMYPDTDAIRRNG